VALAAAAIRLRLQRPYQGAVLAAVAAVMRLFSMLAISAQWRLTL
jgi:hypothetical protein